MRIQFHKYQGTGNDFIVLDNREQVYDNLATERIKSLCDRRFGIGADGLMLLNLRAGQDFEMIYYNADGRVGSMCGNGGRCLVKFAHDLGIHRNKYHFIASDGNHEAEINPDGSVELQMKDVRGIREYHGDFILDTGSPHYVKMVNDLAALDVFAKGKDIRNSSEFAKEGINVNFVNQAKPDEIMVRTYERGVEDETWSCGTGVVASALVCYHNDRGYNDVTVSTRGGKLVVKYDRIGEDSFSNIWLCGPAEKVFEGTAQ
jgi:diaminopimelate epimerase